MNTYMLEDINLKDFMVVKKDLFSRNRVPFLSINQGYITVNVECHQLLNNCEAVQFLVNMNEREIVIKPTPSMEETAVTWRNEKLVKKALTKFNCPQLGMQIFKNWNLDPKYQYRMKGILAKADNKVVLLFRLEESDIFEGLKKVGKYE